MLSETGRFPFLTGICYNLIVMAPLHKVLPVLLAFASIIGIDGLYGDDGYFDPRTVKPRHFSTDEEVIEDEFYEALIRERRLDNMRNGRTLQDTDDGTAAGDDYTENPDDGGDGEVGLAGGMGGGWGV